MAQLLTIFEYVQRGTHGEEIVDYVTRNPNCVRNFIPGNPFSLLHLLVRSGNVELFKEIYSLPRVYFSLGFETSNGKTFEEVLSESDLPAQVDADGKPIDPRRPMQAHLTFLREWDTYCLLAKEYMDTTNERIWRWLRLNSASCYRAPVCFSLID